MEFKLKLWIKWNFVLTMFELTVCDLYKNISLIFRCLCRVVNVHSRSSGLNIFELRVMRNTDQLLHRKAYAKSESNYRLRIMSQQTKWSSQRFGNVSLKWRHGEQRQIHIVFMTWLSNDVMVNSVRSTSSLWRDSRMMSWWTASDPHRLYDVPLWRCAK